MKRGLAPYQFYQRMLSYIRERRKPDSLEHLVKQRKSVGIGMGFTLIETLVAILMLSLMLSGASALIQQALQASSKIKNDTTALFLAQEALELVRYQRDTNRLTFPTDRTRWMDGILGGSLCGSPQPCVARLDPTTGAVTFVKCTGIPCTNSINGEKFLYYNSTSKLYTHEQSAGWVKTPYSRLITVACIGVCVTATEVRVQVTVAWTTIFGARNYIVEENLLNWQ